MKFLSGAAALVAGIAVAGTVAFAGGHSGNPVAKARSSQMGLYAYYLGILGEMAKGARPYDAEVASVAATDLATVAGYDQSLLWVAGTDTASISDTRALPKIWEDSAGFAAEVEKIAASTAAMADVAGNGLEALQAAMGAVGASCGSCHKAYREPRN